MNNKYVQQFKKGSLEMILLCLIGRKETYGYEIITELNNSASVLGYAKEGTIYPILYRLQEAELIKCRLAPAAANGGSKKYYSLTDKGTAEQFGIDNTKSKKRNGIISTLAALVIAAAAFSVYAVTQSGKVPEGAIGQADATTNIQIEGAFAFDISQILLAIGFAATAIALLLIIRTIHKNRR